MTCQNVQQHKLVELFANLVKMDSYYRCWREQCWWYKSINHGASLGIGVGGSSGDSENKEHAPASSMKKEKDDQHPKHGKNINFSSHGVVVKDHGGW